MYQAHGYDLILLDDSMPVQGCLQVMHGLRHVRREGDLPAFVVTTSPEHRPLVLESGAKEFLPKPFERTEVLTSPLRRR